MKLLLLLASLPAVLAQPGGGMAMGGSTSPGAATSTVCGSATTCSSTASAFSSRSLSYANGIFSGSITANGCPSLVTTFTRASASCQTQTFPASATYTSVSAAGVAAPTLGRVGLSLKGMNIYGPLEAGFSRRAPPACATWALFPRAFPRASRTKTLKNGC